MRQLPGGHGSVDRHGNDHVGWKWGLFKHRGEIQSWARTVGQLPAPPTRQLAELEHTAVWTGTEMIVWGGMDVHFNFLNTGGRYNPGTDSWTPTSVTNAPSGRVFHTAVWTGSQMIVWGGAANVLGI